ncbi:MAG TPA: efflux RND transporter periplasmic adaptor subunit [Terriglobales bacterium]|nr:efflux RND transporter periplasmic adaptor subunit [Terriglobales bacterium]
MPTETEHTDSRHEDLRSLRIDHSLREGGGEPPAWSRRIILGGIAAVVLLGIVALAYRAFAGDTPEVEVARAAAEGSDVAGSTVLSASGYIVAHHKISVNSKVTGRVAWIGVEKGDKVKEGQVLVRLEDEEYRAQYEQARGAVESYKARLLEAQNGSRPEEIKQADHNLSEARATAINDKINLDRTRELFAGGVASKQNLDDAIAKYESSQQRMNSLEQSSKLMQLGPRAEEIARAKGDLLQAEGSMAYAKSQLDATVIRAPVSGTILDRTAEKGELVTAQFASGAEGGPRGSVVALADLNDIQVELDIAQDDFAKLSPKQEGMVTLDAFKDRSYKGEIAEMSPEANRQKATVQVKVQILQPDSYLRPEMNASVQFKAKENTDKNATAKQNYVFVPTTALRDKDGKKFVLLAFNGKALRRDVHVQGQRSGGYLVDSLVGGENLITAGPADLQDGQKIRIKGQS